MSRTSASSPASTKKTAARLVVLVATRKGAWFFHSDGQRKTWTIDGPHFLGHTISHVMLDPRDGRTLLAAAKTGHLGPTVFRSTNLGRSWKEAQQPPAFAPATNGLPGRSVDHTFWLTPGHASEPGSWYAGTSPQGLFRSIDAGVSWAPLPSVNDDPRFREWMGSAQDGTPDGPKLHSVIVDPRDPKHLYFGMSGGGVHESRDGGQSWTTLIQGMEVVEGFDAATVTFHDPHCVRLCPGMPDRLYQQNHCGIYRLDRTDQPSGDVWQRIGRKMPKRVGDVGFPMVVHPRDPDAAWVFPMDGTDVWPRTSPAGQPAAYVTRNAGKTWQRLDQGLPESQAWWTVKRQAMTVDAQAKPALYLGTTGGELWIGRDEGASWTNIARHLPEIYAVEVAELA
ncbi:MAG: glycosyl hydrolase [Burkholderiaceae bacterium]|nr:glycosyl hydrolase [Burkholderiaceae bacterium]